MEIIEPSVETSSTKTTLMQAACKKIAPLWSLENFVAVNPYMGLIDQNFNQVASELDAIGNIKMTLPLSFYLKKIKDGEIPAAILQSVLDHNQIGSIDDFMLRIQSFDVETENKTSIPTVIDIAAQISTEDWNRFVLNRISFWAASYFDHGQAAWKVTNKDWGLFLSWKKESLFDLTPELSGLKDFRSYLKRYPDNAMAAADVALKELNIPDEMLPAYLHRILLRANGWAGIAARVDWDSKLYGGKSNELMEYLSVLLCWEACMLKCLSNPQLQAKWEASKKAFLLSGMDHPANEILSYKLMLQEAFDLSVQQKIINLLTRKRAGKPAAAQRPAAQAVFCIDVRSEVFRRNLEATDPNIQTFGFAGFFAFPISYVPIGHQQGESQCPVLLKTGPTILEEMGNTEETKKAASIRILNHQLRQTLKSVKYGAITCFSYVSPLGLSFLPKLFTDSFGLTRPVPHPNTVGLPKSAVKNKRIRLDAALYKQGQSGIHLMEQIIMAKNALCAMSLTNNFAKFVLIAGHGSSTVNNPHATGLDCGACGGHTGEANARVAAEIFNSKHVREGLQQHNIFIPADTVFLACLHDTTTDEFIIYNEDAVAPEHAEAFSALKSTLKKAGSSSRLERAARMHISGSSDVESAVIGRSKDWSQVRPEWGLAGCYGFIVAPRTNTLGIDFGGKTFLHTYDWKTDQNFSILELIMTAPMIVTSWINLQYYASTVDNKNFGSGNKTLHNITAGIGVIEGNSGDIRSGLPIQSVFDGDSFQHEPVKLNVIIKAPLEAMNNIIMKHEMVRHLVDHNWIHLLAINEDDQVSHRYDKHLNWVEL